MEYTLSDFDDVPSAIMLFCSSIEVDAALFTRMWLDLQTYVENQNEANSDVLGDIVSAILALTSEAGQMDDELYSVFMSYASEYLIDNTDIVPISDDLVHIADICYNYMMYGSLNRYNGESFEVYLAKITSIVNLYVQRYTSSYLVTQESLKGTESTEYTKLYKYRDFPTSMQGMNLTLSENSSIRLPVKLPYEANDIINIRANFYNYLGDEYSDIVELSFTKSGNYSNY